MTRNLIPTPVQTMKLIFLILFSSISFLAASQHQANKLTAIELNDLSAFENPQKNWRIVGGAAGAYLSNKIETTKGVGVLFNDFKKDQRYQSDANLFTKIEHGDIILSLDFMMPQGSNSGVYLQGRYEVQLFDSWGVKTPRNTDCGSIYERWNEALREGKKGYEGHPARTNAALAPGLWQHLDIEFRAPKFDESGNKIEPARFVRVALNGIVIHENVIVTGPTRAAAFNDEKPFGPLMIQGDHGPVVFRNLNYALLNKFEVPLTDLQYEYYEGSFSSFSQLTPDKLTRKGTSEFIDSRLADDPNKLGLLFTGKITVPESEEYQFTIRAQGNAKLEVDGKDITGTQWIFGDFSTAVNLSAGVHTFTLGYIKNFSWAGTGLGLFISKVNARPLPLHVAASLPKIAPVPMISVKNGAMPELVRSFSMFGGKKKTHVISVGDASGIHYMYDLRQGALLQVWRGEFLNVTDMWYERGEPQTASPLGAAVYCSGRSPFAYADEQSMLPDTLDDRNSLIYNSTTMDPGGNPTFHYQYNKLKFTDAFRPNVGENGLIRTLSLLNSPGNEKLFIRIAEGNAIQQVGDDIYSIDNRYYIRYTPVGKIKPVVTRTGNKTELVVEYAPKLGSSFSYHIIW